MIQSNFKNNIEYFSLKATNLLTLITQLISVAYLLQSLLLPLHSYFSQSRAYEIIQEIKIGILSCVLIAVIFQVILFLMKPNNKNTILSIMPILFVLSSLFLHLVIITYFKTLNQNQDILSAENDDRFQTCLLRQEHLWPKNSIQIYDQAQKEFGTPFCPFQSQTGKSIENYQSCSSRNTEKFPLIKNLVEELQQIETELQCSGVCKFLPIFYFSDVKQAPVSPMGTSSCYHLAFSNLQESILTQKEFQLSLSFLIASLVISIAYELLNCQKIAISNFFKRKFQFLKFYSQPHLPLCATSFQSFTSQSTTIPSTTQDCQFLGNNSLQEMRKKQRTQNQIKFSEPNKENNNSSS